MGKRKVFLKTDLNIPQVEHSHDANGSVIGYRFNHVCLSATDGTLSGPAGHWDRSELRSKLL